MAFSESSAFYNSRIFSFILGHFGILASESSFNVNWPPGAAPGPISVLKLSHTRGRSASPFGTGVDPESKNPTKIVLFQCIGPKLDFF